MSLTTVRNLTIFASFLSLRCPEVCVGLPHLADDRGAVIQDHSGLAFLDPRPEQDPPLAQSGEYREHSVPQRGEVLRLRRNLSDGRGRYRSGGGVPNSSLRGHADDLPIADFPSAFPLAQGLADDGAGCEKGDQRRSSSKLFS